MIARAVAYVEITRLSITPDLQNRAALDNDVVREYAESMKSGAVFPPVLAFSDGNGFWLADGHHRTAARLLLDFTTVLAEIRDGTKDDAIWAGCSVNQAHGLRRTNEDKHRSVERALLHSRAARLSDRQIATHCGVHHATVSRVRRKLQQEKGLEEVPSRDVVRGSATYSMSTSAIGSARREHQLAAVVGSDEAAKRARSQDVLGSHRDAVDEVPSNTLALQVPPSVTLARASKHLARATELLQRLDTAATPVIAKRSSDSSSLDGIGLLRDRLRELHSAVAHIRQMLQMPSSSV